MTKSEKIKSKSAGSDPLHARKVSLEFVRISKLVESGRKDEALRAASDLHTAYPDEATPNFIMALVFAEIGQKARALPYAERAEKKAPDNAAFTVFLGKLYVDLGMIEFAPVLLHKAFAMEKTLYQAPLALARYYYEVGQANRALGYYDLALPAVPASSVATVRASRAECLKSLGRVNEAEAEYKFCIDVPELRVKSLVAIALLNKNDHTSIHANEVRHELLRPGLTIEDRSALLLCLGRLYENGRDYDSAFLNFDQSRKLLNSKFNIGDIEMWVDDVIGCFTSEVFERYKEFGSKSEKPIFVVGMPRSGTTMMEQIIAAHSRVQGVGELTRMSRMSRFFGDRGGMRQLLAKMDEVGPKKWMEMPQQYLNLLNVLAPDAHHTVDKLPHNFRHLGFIHLCFPRAKIIHCRRNPLDTFISAFQNPLKIVHNYCFDQVTYGEYYVHYLRLMEHMKKVMFGSIHEIQYETLTESPETEVRKILSFLNLPWEEACLKFNERETVVKTLSHLQVRNPINTGSVARWRHYEKHLAPIMTVFDRAGVRY